jgi:hypothetical protein
VLSVECLVFVSRQVRRTLPTEDGVGEDVKMWKFEDVEIVKCGDMVMVRCPVVPLGTRYR